VPDEPWRAPEDVGPNFSRKASFVTPVQIWWDSWRRRDRTVRFIGLCIVCTIPTWAFDDGENDPRGALGDSACWPTDLDFQGVGYDVTTCAICANTYETYKQAQDLARAELTARATGKPGAHPSAKIERLE
jgi:hypothetical protein